MARETTNSKTWLRISTGLGHKEAKAVVDAAPVPVKEGGVKKKKQNAIKNQFVEAGLKLNLNKLYLIYGSSGLVPLSGGTKPFCVFY